MKRGIEIRIVFFLVSIMGISACIVAPPYPPQEQDVEASGTGGMGQGGSESISSSSSSTGMPAPSDECGDGVRGPTEMCDDWNKISGDACTSDCKCGYAPPVSIPIDELKSFSGASGECYIAFVKRSPHWWLAESACMGLNMHLATIATVPEIDLIKQNIASDVFPLAIGAYLKDPKQPTAGWAWTSGEPWNNSLNPWGTNNSGLDNTDTEHCARLTAAGIFNTVSYDSGNHFICEGTSL